MNPSREELLFAAALAKPANERAPFIEGACHGDAALRHRLEALLAVHEQPGSLLTAQAEAARPTMKLEPGEAPDEAVGQTIGRYKLLEKIGEGGCGVVYVAEQTEPVRRRVALKVIKLGMDTKAVVARFEAERQALAMMDHPNIAKVLDAGTTEMGRPFFVMELVRGIRITEFCDQANLSTKDRLDLFIKVCQAIQHAHQKGIIHRDIKPSNILVTLHDGVPVPKVIDFGIAKATEGRLTDATVYTQLHQFIGTPAYMSPEQAEMSGLDIDTRSDIYSLGVLLYELLAGSTPFDAQELMASGLDAMRQTIREQEPVRPSTRLATLKGEELTTTARRRSTDTTRLLHQLKGDLDWIVMKCLEKDRARRYETANGLAADLRRYLTNETVLARPPSALYRMQKMVRRNKLAFAAGAAVAATLVAGLVVSGWSYLKERDARQRAVAAEQRAEAARNNESGLRQRAEQAAATAEVSAADAKRALAASDFEQALRLIESDKTREAAAHLARSVALHPSGPAASRLASLLADRWWLVPTVIASNTTKAVLSPDGSRVAAAVPDDSLRIFDSRTGQPLLQPLPHGAPITDINYTTDGKYLLSASPTKIRCWDAHTGAALSESVTFDQTLTWRDLSAAETHALYPSEDGTIYVLEIPSLKLVTDKIKHRGPVQSANFLDAKRIVTTHERSMNIWDIQTGLPLIEPIQHAYVIGSLSVSPDATRVITWAGRVAQIWDLRSKQRTALIEQSSFVQSAGFSPDGNTVCTGSKDRTVRLWDAATGAAVGEPFQHESPVYFAEYSPDARWLRAWCEDGSIHLWDIRSRQRVTGPLKQEAFGAQFSQDGRRLLTISADRLVRVWDFLGAPQLNLEIQHPMRTETARRSIGAARFSPDGRKLATAGSDRTIRLWDAATGRALAFAVTNSYPHFNLEFSRDGARLLTFGRLDAQVCDVHSGKALGEPIRQSKPLDRAEFSPDGLRVATASDQTAQLWDAGSGRPIGKPLPHEAAVLSMHFSPDGKRIVTGAQGGAARVWDVESQTPLTAPLPHSADVALVQFSPDGTQIATAAYQTVEFWDARTSEKSAVTLGHNHHVSSVRYSPDGRKIVTASWDGAARVWDAQSGAPLTPPMKHADGVLMAAFSPDGSRLVTASADQTARVWDALTAQPLSDPSLHASNLRFAEFSPDGHRVLTVATDAARVWDFPPSSVAVPDWLAPLAETIAGETLRPDVLIPSDARPVLAAFKARFEEAPENPWNKWGRWLLSDPRERTVSVFSKVLLDDHIEKTLRSPSLASLAGIERFAHADPDLTNRIAAAHQRLESASAGVKLFREAHSLRFAGKAEEALAKMLEAAALDYVPALNGVAWTLATSSNNKLRDGRRAVEFARRAIAAAELRNPTYLDTLAAAHAEAGDFESAVLTVEEALRLPALPQRSKDFSDHLASFKARKPWREQAVLPIGNTP